jgi:hypothetical protein
MKNKNLICIYAPHPLFNLNLVPVIENFSRKNTVYLFTLLLSNNLDLLNKTDINADYIYCLDERDKEFIPKYFFPENYNSYFYDVNKMNDFIKNLNTSYFEKHVNTLVLLSNTIGVSIKTIDKVIDLLAIEDESVVIGKTSKNNLAFFGFNVFNPAFFKRYQYINFDYDNFLTSINSTDNFLNVLDGYMSIKDFNDFKELYINLSNKESLVYCGQEMHENFNNLFIEYKDYLK